MYEPRKEHVEVLEDLNPYKGEKSSKFKEWVETEKSLGNKLKLVIASNKSEHVEEAVGIFSKWGYRPFAQSGYYKYLPNSYDAKYPVLLIPYVFLKILLGDYSCLFIPNLIDVYLPNEFFKGVILSSNSYEHVITDVQIVIIEYFGLLNENTKS